MTALRRLLTANLPHPRIRKRWWMRAESLPDTTTCAQSGPALTIEDLERARAMLRDHINARSIVQAVTADVERHMMQRAPVDIGWLGRCVAPSNPLVRVQVEAARQQEIDRARDAIYAEILGVSVDKYRARQEDDDPGSWTNPTIS
jgi:hypothetical protein